ncbi:hypothetical protein G9A89_013456 [Geosiphon pyriformis]|nr:hypothetical protein G9A89_013456 [Geosiphon pyriformis]
MDMKATANSTTPKKRTPKSPADGFFSQKKKVVFGNVKHFGDEKNISLSKSGSSGSVYSDVESLSSEDENVSMSETNGEFLLGSVATMPKTKQVNTGAGFGFPLGSPNFHMDDDEVVLPSHLSTFTLEKSMEMTVLLARENKIVINTNLKKQEVCLDWAVVIKEIFMNIPKKIIVTAAAKFEEIRSIKIQLIGMWQKAVTSRDWFRVLLFTLPVETTAHNLGTLLEKTGEKTCIINRSLETGNRFHCAVVGFEFNKELESAFFTEPIFSGIHLFWTRLDLVQYGKCRCFGHSVLKCDVHDLTKLYAKKNVPISRLAAFVVSSASSSGGSSFSSGLFSGGMPPIVGLSSHQIVGLNDCLAVLECFLEIFSDQVSVILKKLSFVELVPLAASSCVPSLAVFVPSASVVDSDMILDDVLALVDPPFSGSSESATILSSSGSKVYTSKIGGLESKMSVLKTSFGSILKVAMYNIHGINIPTKQKDVVHWHFDSGNLISIITETKLRSSTRLWIVNKFDNVRIFSSGLDKRFHDAGVAIIMADSLACHVAKIKKVPGHVMMIHLLFKDKLSVSVVGLYAGASSGTCFGQASEVNSVITKAVNSSCFVILGEDFNENRSGRNASFKFCLGLGLVNMFAGHFLVSNSTWSNFKGVKKTIDFIFVNKSLASAITGHDIGFVSDFFNTDYCVVSVFVGLGSLLDGHLNSLCKQTNRDHWKFLIKAANRTKWSWFRDCTFAKLLAVFGKFSDTLACADVDDMWVLLEKVLFINVWAKLDGSKAAVIANMIQVGDKSSDVLKQLSLFWKEYRKSKMYESKLVEKASVQKAIKYCMEKFCSNKGVMIRSVMDQPFCKVVLNHLVVNNKLVLKLDMVKLGVNKIMEGWIRKRMVLSVVPDIWACQYAPLDYVRDNAFLDVMCLINMNELLLVVNNLPDGKAAGLSGILNELWKHCSDMVLKCLLGLLNSCLTMKDMPVLWKKAWMARKILSKILSDRIFVACSKFGVLQDDNFLVLKGTSMQSLVFAIGSVIKDALEKNREIWLVLQNMCKAYDSVEWHHLRTSLRHIKMCERFVSFFGNIHENRINRIMMDFGLSNSYMVCDELDQSEVFSPFLFVSKLGCIESGSEFFSYFAAGAFNILDIASGFFALNDISINNEKTVAIPINQGVRVASLHINGLPISIAKKDEAHHYLGIFLSINRLLKPSLAKTHSDVYFFTNMVLKSKAGLSRDFSTKALCHFFLYSLKSFEQVQSKGKLAVLISFSNSFGVLKCLFKHRFLNLQVLGWFSLNSLQFPVKLCVSSVNNFLAGVVRIFLCNKLSLANNLPNVFHSPGRFPVSSILKGSLFFDSVCSLKWFGVAFSDRLFDKKGRVVSEFLCGKGASLAISVESTYPSSLSILNTKEFSVVQNGLHEIWSGSFEVFMDGSVRNYGCADVASRAAAYFSAIDLSVGIRILGLLSFTMAELQVIALALECILSSCSVVLYFDSQMAINACVSEMSLSLERCRIFNLVHDKNFSVHWVKIKGHFGVHGNVRVDAAAGDAAFS